MVQLRYLCSHKGIGSVVLLLLLFTSSALAQSDGDYRTIVTGSANWSDIASWEVYNSGWIAATEYPGQSAGTGDVSIENGAQVTLDISPGNAIGSLTFADGTTSATDITMGSSSLTVTGAITFGNPDADAGDQNIYVNSGTLTCGSVEMVNTGSNSEDTRIDIEDGTLTVNGDINQANSNRNNIRFVGVATGELYIDGDFNGNGFTMGSSSTVYYNNAGNQIVGNVSYRNLQLTGGSKTLRNSANVYGTLTLGTILDIENRRLYLGNASTLIPETSYSSSEMINISNNGYIQKAGNTASDFEITYPIGIGGEYTPMILTSVSGSDVNGNLYVRLYESRHTLTVGSDNALTRYWDISSSGLNITSSTGSFNYSDNDVLVPIVEGNLTTVGHFDGSIWQENEPTTSYNHSSNQISFTNVSQLEGEWTLGESTGCFDGLPAGTFSVQAGNWNSASTWNTGVVPGQGGNEDVTVFHNVGDLNIGFTVNNLTIEENGTVDFDNDDVTINNDFTIKGNANDDNSGGSVDVGGNLIVESTGDFNIQRCNLTVTGTTTVNGTISDTDGNGSSTFTGLFTVESGGTYTSNRDDFDFVGGIENNGSFTNSSSFTVNQDLTITGTSEVQFTNDIYIADNVTVTNENNAGLSITDQLDGLGANATFINKGLVNYNDGDRVPMNTGILDCSSFANTFDYNRNGRQYIKPVTYYNLIASNNNDKELQTGTTTVLNDLTTSGTADFECLGRDLIISGSVTHSSTGVFTTGSNTVAYNGTGAQNILDVAYAGNLIIEGSGTKSLQNMTTVAGDVTIQGTATLKLNSQQFTSAANITLSSGAALEVDENATLQIADGATITNNGIFKVVGTSGNPATVTTSGSGGYLINQTDAAAEFHALYGVFDYSGGITITDGTVDNTNNFSNTTFSNGTGTEYLNVSGFDPVGGLSSVQEVVFEAGPTYNVTRTSGVATVDFVESTGILSGENHDNDNANPGTLIEWSDPSSIYYSTGDVSAYATASWAHNEDGTGGNPTLADLTAGSLILVVQDGHTVTLDSNGDIDVRRLIIGEGTSGSFLIGSDATQQTLTIQELIEVKNGATLIPNSAGGPAHVIKLYGNLSNYGTINLRQDFTTVANVEIYGTIDFVGTNTPVFSDLIFKSGSYATANIPLDINWNLTLESGATFNDGGNTHTIEYNWVNNGGTFAATGGFIFDGGTASIVSTGTPTTFNDVTFNNAGLNTIKESIIVNGDFVANNNTQISVDNATVTVNSNFNIEAGSQYVQLSNTTNFNGTSAQVVNLNGTTSFDDVNFSNGGANAKTVTGNIIASGRITVNNGATVDGTGDHEITGGLRVNGTCDFSGSITMNGGYLDTNDASVSTFSLGTAELIIKGTVYLTHSSFGETITITSNNDVTVTTGGSLVINDDAVFVGQVGNTLTVEKNRYLYIRGADNFPNGFGAYAFDESALITYDGAMDQVIRAGTYGRLILRYAYNKTVDGPVVITGYLYLRNECNFDLQNYSHIFSGASIYNSGNNGSIDGSNATFTIDGGKYSQYFESTGTGRYVFKDLIISQTGATGNRTKNFYSGCNISVTNDLSIENSGGTVAIQNIVNLYDNEIEGPANNFSLGTYCKLYTSHTSFGSGVIDNFTGTKTFDVTSTVRYNLNGAQDIADGITYGNITFNGGDKTAEGALDIDGDISRISNTPVFYDGGYTHTISGNWILNSTNYYTQTSATGTIVFDGVDQDINGYNFNNITIANSGTANLFRDLNIYGNLTVNDGSAFNASSLDMNIGGNILVNGTGVYSQTTGITNMNGDVDQSITLTNTSTIGDLTINKTNPAGETVSLLSDVQILDDLTVNRDAGVLDISNQNLYVGDDFTIYDYTGVTNFVSTGSTVTFNGSAAQQITTYHEDNLAFNNLVFEGSGDKTFDYNNPPDPDLASQNIDVNGNFTIDGSTVNGNNVSLYVRGDWSNNGTFTHSRTVYFDGTAQNISSSEFYHVNFQGSDTKALTGNITIRYDLYIEGTATLDANGNDITLGDDWNNNVVGASYVHGNGKVIFNGSSLAEVHSGTTTGSLAGKNFYDVEINKSNRVDLYGDLVVENDLSILSNQLRTNAYDVYVAGNFDNQATYYCNNNSSLLTLNATGGSKIFNPNGATIRGLTINASGATYEMQSDFILDNVDMSILAGTLDLNKNQLQLYDSGRKIDIDGGTLIVDSASTILFTNTQSLNLNSGELYLVGKEGMTANLENSHSSNGFTVNAIGGTLYANHYSIQKGNIMISGSAIDASNNLSNGTYKEGDSGTSYITLNGLDLGGDITLTNMTFNSGADNNISRTSGNGVVTVQDASGDLAGEIYEIDNGVPGTLIEWTFPAGFYWDGQGSAANTDWNEPLNWDGNTVPGINNIVYLDHSILTDAYNINISGTDGACMRLNMDVQGGNAISVNVDSNTKLDVQENVNIGTGATLSQTDNTALIYVGKNWSNNGTYTHGNSKVVFNGASGSYIISSGGIGAGKAFYDLEFDAGTSLYTIDTVLDIDNDLTITSGTFDQASSDNDITVGGDWYLDQANGGSFDASNADVTFDGTTQSITNGTFYNLIIGGTSTTTVNSNIAIDNSVTLNNGSSLNAQENNMYISRHWQNDGGTFSQTGLGTVIFNGTSTQYIDQGTNTTTFNNITFSNTGGKILANNVNVNGDVLISDASGTVNVVTYTLNGIGADNTLTNNEDLQIEGASNFPTGFETHSFSSASQTNYYSDIDQQIEATTYGSLSLRSLTDGITSTKTALGDLFITNDLYMNSTTRHAILDLATNDANVTLSDNIDLRGNSSMTWGTGDAILEHIGGRWYIDADITGFNHLILAGTDDKYTQGDLTITGDLTIKSGVDLFMYTSSGRNNYKNITGTASGTLSMETGATIRNSRPATDGVAIPEGFGTYDFNENSGYYLYSDGIDQTVYTGSNIAYGNLTFYTASSKTVTGDGVANLDVNGDFDIEDATYNDGGTDIEVAGANIYLTDYVASSSDRTIILDGLRDQHIRDDVNNQVIVQNITFTGTGIKTICDGNDVATINGDLTINPGISVTAYENITFNGANWTNNGTYSQTANSLTFSGTSDQTIDPGAPDASNYFHTVVFSGASTKTFVNNGADINNDFTINEGTVDLGSLDYTIQDEITNTSGGTLISANANINLDGGGQTVNSPNFAVNNITCSGSSTKYLSSDWTVGGDLLIESGVTLDVGNGSNYDITIAGNWTNEGTFYDRNGKVTFNGSISPVTITSGGDNFYDVDFTPGASVKYNLVSTATRFTNQLYIGTNAELDLNNQTLYLGRDNTGAVTHTIDGTLTIDEGSYLYVNNDNSQTTLDVYGAFNVVGTDASNIATLTSETTSNVNKTQVNIQSGATMAARYYIIEYIADEGINLMPGSTLDAVNNFSDGAFVNMRDQQDARYLVLEADYTGGNITNVVFNYDGIPAEGRHYNVERKLASTDITFENVSGALGKYKFEDDDQAVAYDNGLCRWPLVTETYWTGAIDTDWHKDGNWDNGVPTELMDAIIPDVAVDPIIFGGNAICKSLSITDGILRLESDNNITVSENVTITDGLLFVNSSGSNIYVGGDWTVSTFGNFTHGDATVTFNSGNGYVTITPGTSNFNNVVFDNASTTFGLSSASLNIEGDLTIANGTLSPTTNNHIINLYGDYSITNGSFDHNGASNGTIVLKASGDQTVTAGAFENLQVDGSGTKYFTGVITVNGNTDIYSTLSAQAGSGITFTGDVNIDAAGTFADGGESHTFTGTNWYGSGTYSGSGTIVFNRTSGYQYLYASTFNNLDINCTAQRLYLEEDVTINGDMTFRNGINRVDLQTNTITSDGSGTFTVEDAVNVYVYGADNFPKSFASYNLSATSITRYYSSSDQNIEGVSYGHLYFDNANTKTLTGDTEVKGNLIFLESTLDVSTSNYTLTVGGYWDNDDGSGGNFICRSGEVIFNNSIDRSIYIGAANGNDFYDLTINSGAIVYANNNVVNDFTVQNNLNVTSGQFSGNSRTIYVGGDLVANASGSFVQSGSYYLNKASGSANIGANGSEFWNITINGGATYTAQDDITLDGSFTLTSGVFDGNGNTINLGNGGSDVVTIDGTYKVGAGGVLGIGNGTSLTVSSTGKIEVVGDGTGIAKVSNNDSGGSYSFTVEGEIAAEYYLFENMSSVGIYLTTSSTIDATYHFSNGTFSGSSSSGPQLRIENTQSFTDGGGNRIENVSFPNDPGGTASNVAKYTAGSGTLEFYNSTGVFAGEGNDNDPGDLINWTGPVSLTWNGSISTDWNTAANWTASSGGSIVPTAANDVVIASAVNQPILTIAGQQTGNLTIEAGAELRINTSVGDHAIDMNVDGDLTIDGTLRTISAEDSITVEGNWTVGGVATALLNGDVTFDGTGNAKTIDNGGEEFYSLTISGTTQYQLASNTDVNTNLTIESGATLDVGSSNYSLYVEGDWTNSGTFDAQQGTVYLTATSGTKTIQAGSSDFYNLNVNASGVIYNLTGDMTVSEQMNILAGTVDVQTNTLQIGDGSGTDEVAISGTLLINAGATLDMADGAGLNVNSGGAIELLGTDELNRATLTSSTAGRYSFDVNSGASIKASYYNVDYTDADGLYMHSGADIDETYDLSNGIFSNGDPGSGSYMTILHDMAAAQDTLRNLVFNSGPTYNVTRTSGTTVFHFEDASGDLGNYLFEKDDEGTPSPSSGLLRWPFVSLYTWEGDVSNDWFDAGNWYNDVMPDAGSTVTIPADGTVIIDNSSTVEIHGFDITLGGTLTIEPGGQLTTNGDVNTADGFIIQNTNVSPASYISNGLVNGNVTVEWTYDNLRWWFIGHGISNPQMSSYESIRAPQGSDYAMYDYLNNGTYDKLSDKPGSVDLAVENELKGYLFKVKDSGSKVVHTGTINTDAVYSRPLQDEWQIMANPYPAYYQLAEEPGLGADFENTTGSVYVTESTRNTDKVFHTFNTLSGIGSPNSFNGILAPSQAFYVKTDAGKAGTDVFMRADKRIHDAARSSLKSTKNSESDVLRINVSNEHELTDEAVIALRDNGDLEYSRMDSEQRFYTNNVSYIYSIIGENKAVINVLPKNVDGLSQAVGLQAKDGNHSIQITGIESLSDTYDIVLEDKVTGNMVSMDNQTSYDFACEAGTYDDRFVLHFNEVPIPTSIDDDKSAETVRVYVADNNTLKVYCDWTIQEKTVSIYTISGTKVMNEEFEGEQFEYELNVKPGIYVVKVAGKDHSYKQKILVR